MDIKDKKSEKPDLSFPDQKIVPINMETRVKQAFLEYSMSVIISRALPDVRDGLKPGQRRIIYAMYEDGLVHSQPFRKSATTVGNVLGRYHPHGDQAVYGTMVRMAQPFSLRYPLIEGHGNFGSVDGDGAAAYRYTEARMSKIADELVRDIDKNVIKWNKNFDNQLDEPEVLPSRFPNILVNGSVGIAVGMATNIPPHNLREVIDGTLYLMDNPSATLGELMQYIKGPDFPTAATIYGASGIIEAYKNGRGRVIVRAKAKVEEEKRRIIVTEIPYQVNKSMLIEAMAAQVRDKKIEGITEIRDESGRDGMRIVIEYRRDANGQIILNQLYKYTQMQDTCAINMLALVGGEPKVLPLKDLLTYYIAFQEDVITRRVKFDLDKAEKEAHIYEGYKIAIDNIDEVVHIIRSSSDTADAKINLSNRFDLTDEQAQAIVSMTLGRLTGLERGKIEARLNELYGMIAEFKAILADESKIRDIIRSEMTEIRDKYGDDRRTELVEAKEEILYEDLIDRHHCVITITHGGYVKRVPADTYTAQRRGGKGIIGMSTKEEDYIEQVIVADSHSLMLMFTNSGIVHSGKAYRIPEASRTAKGTHVMNLLELKNGEKVTATLSVNGFGEDEYLVMVTKYGRIKRTPLSEFAYQRKGGKIAINLTDGDELIFVARTRGLDDIIIATHNGIAARFPERLVMCHGRTAGAMRAIKLEDGDYVVGAAMISNDEGWENDHKLITITEGGFGKRMEPSAFDAKGRGIKGVICHNITDKTGCLAGISVVSSGDDLMLITDDGQMIRTPSDEIPVYGRNAGGVIVMRLAEGSRIVSFALAKSESDAEIAAEEARGSDISSGAEIEIAALSDDDDDDEAVISEEEDI